MQLHFYVTSIPIALITRGIHNRNGTKHNLSYNIQPDSLKRTPQLQEFYMHIWTQSQMKEVSVNIPWKYHNSLWTCQGNEVTPGIEPKAQQRYSPWIILLPAMTTMTARVISFLITSYCLQLSCVSISLSDYLFCLCSQFFRTMRLRQYGEQSVRVVQSSKIEIQKTDSHDMSLYIPEVVFLVHSIQETLVWEYKDDMILFLCNSCWCRTDFRYHNGFQYQCTFGDQLHFVQGFVTVLFHLTN